MGVWKSPRPGSVLLISAATRGGDKTLRNGSPSAQDRILFEPYPEPARPHRVRGALSGHGRPLGDGCRRRALPLGNDRAPGAQLPGMDEGRSEEHTSELQSLAYLVCRLLLEKKKNEQLTLTPLLC